VSFHRHFPYLAILVSKFISAKELILCNNMVMTKHERLGRRKAKEMFLTGEPEVGGRKAVPMT